jgi:hypothetical protein
MSIFSVSFSDVRVRSTTSRASALRSYSGVVVSRVGSRRSSSDRRYVRALKPM